MWLAQRAKDAITYAERQAGNVPGFPNVQWLWITKALWVFICEVSPGTRSTVSLKVGPGQEMNGLELWRNMYYEYEGGAAEVRDQHRECFVRCPKCHVPTYIHEHLNAWEALAGKHGATLPDEHHTKRALPHGASPDQDRNPQASKRTS